MSKKPRIYWDSCCFLAFLKEEEETDRFDRCNRIIQRAAAEKLLILTSAITLAEVTRIRDESRILKKQADIIDRFFDMSLLRVVSVTRKIGKCARLIVRKYGIKHNDAIHVATAVHFRADELQTFDKKLLNKTVPSRSGRPLLIREPPFF